MGEAAIDSISQDSGQEVKEVDVDNNNQEVKEDRGDEVTPVTSNITGSDDEQEAKGSSSQDVARTSDDTESQDDNSNQGSPQQGQMIPFSRFQEVNLRMQEAEGKLKELTKSQESDASEDAEGQSEEPFDYDGMEAQYVDYLMDGDTEQAAKVRGEINTAMRADAKKEAEESAKAAIASAREAEIERQNAEELNKVANRLTKNYPALDQNHKLYNDQKTRAVLDLTEFYINKGFTPAESLEKSVGQFFQASDNSIISNKADGESRNQSAVERSANAAMSQPPSLQQAGRGGRANEQTVSAANMSEEDFDKLSEADKKKLRGD